MNIENILNNLKENGINNAKVLNVWSNGNAVRKYTGQDVHRNTRTTASERGYKKYKAILIPIEE